MKYSDLYDGNLMKGEWASKGGERMAARAHSRSHKTVNSGYELTPGIRQALKLPMEHNQLAHKEPWGIVFFTPHGRRKRVRYSFLSEAIRVHATLVQTHPTATIVSLNRGYDVPAEYRGRLPKPWKWCPFCMKPRKYRPLLDTDGNRQTFFTLRREWSDEDQRWKDAERELLLMACPVCGQNNRHYMFRRSNQEWKLTKVPKGHRKLRRRRKQK